MTVDDSIDCFENNIGLKYNEMIIWKVRTREHLFTSYDSKVIQKNLHASLSGVMSGYQKTKHKKEYAKSIILITPINKNKHPRVLFMKKREEITKEDSNIMKFKNGNDFEKYFS